MPTIPSAPSAIEISHAHFPDRAPIDAYGNGGFRFADMSHRGGILCLPSGIHAWDAADITTDLTAKHFVRIFDESAAIEILLVGTGESLVVLPEDLRQDLRDRQIMADPMSTGAAVRTFNVLLSENRAVAAALFAVD